MSRLLLSILVALTAVASAEGLPCKRLASVLQTASSTSAPSCVCAFSVAEAIDEFQLEPPALVQETARPLQRFDKHVYLVFPSGLSPPPDLHG